MEQHEVIYLPQTLSLEHDGLADRQRLTRGLVIDAEGDGLVVPGSAMHGEEELLARCVGRATALLATECPTTYLPFSAGSSDRQSRAMMVVTSG